MRRSLYRIPIREDFTRAVLAGGSHLLRRLLRSSGRTRYRYTNNATLGSMTVGAGSTSLGPTCASSRYAIRLRTALHKPGQKPSKAAGSHVADVRIPGRIRRSLHRCQSCAWTRAAVADSTGEEATADCSAHENRVSLQWCAGIPWQSKLCRAGAKSK